MSEKKTPFQKIDQALFGHVNSFKSSPYFLKFSEKLQGLDEELRRPLNYLMTLALVLLPIVVVVLVKWQNTLLEEKVDQKQNILALAKSVQKARSGITKAASGVISPTGLLSEQEFSDKVRSLISAQGVDLSKVKIRNFEGRSLGQGLVQSKAMLEMGRLSMPDLKKILQALTTAEKFRVEHISLKSDPNESILAGNFDLIHYGKAK